MPKATETTMMEMRENFVLITLKEPEKASPGGILLPERAKSVRQDNRGFVVAVGPGKRETNYNNFNELVETEVKVGDEVYFIPHASMEIQYEGETYYVIREPDVFSIVSR